MMQEQKAPFPALAMLMRSPPFPAARERWPQDSSAPAPADKERSMTAKPAPVWEPPLLLAVQQRP